MKPVLLCRSARLVAILCAALLIGAVKANAQKANEELDTVSETTPSEPPTTDNAPMISAGSLLLPPTTVDGRPLRPMGVFQSQIVQIVPRSFREIAIDRLQQLLDIRRQLPADENETRLISGFYDIRLDGQSLSSRFSRIVIEHPSSKAVRRPLATSNLAIGEALGRGANSLLGPSPSVPSLAVAPGGELLALVPAKRVPADPTDGSDGRQTSTESDSQASSDVTWTRSEIQFSWTLKSLTSGPVRKFELRLPRTPQSRLVFSVPSDVTLESAVGVLTESPGPPPDADVQSRAGNIRWYVLEAGGADQIVLYAKRRDEQQSDRPLVVRNELKQYEVDLSGVTWFHRLTLELPGQRSKIRLRAPIGMVTAVQFNNVPVTYDELRRTDGQTLIDVRLPSRFSESDRGSSDPISMPGKPSDPQTQAAASNPSGDTITLTVSGNASWDITDGLCPLPSVLPVAKEVIWTQPSTRSFMTLLKPLRVARWDLPSGWRQVVLAPRQGEIFLEAEGPPTTDIEREEAWSTIQLVQKNNREITDVWTSLRLGQTPSRELRNTTRISCRLLSDQQPPLRLELNPEWTVDSVVIDTSGREIDASAGASELTLWPTTEESRGDRFDIEISARRPVPGNSQRMPVPSDWLVRVPEYVGTHLIAMTPPRLRRWHAESAMLPQRISGDAFSDEASGFFQISDETLLLQSLSGDWPAVALDPPDVSFAVQINHFIESSGSVSQSSDDVMETIIVRAETSQPITELSLLTGTTRSVPFDWSLRRRDESTTVSLPASSVNQPTGDPLGTYSFNLDNRDLRDYELIGRRFFSAEGNLRLSLPSVRPARLQTAEVFLDENWEIISVPDSVQTVPGRPDSKRSRDRSAPETAPSHAQGQHLRYDPLARPEIELRRVGRQTQTCIIWNQLLDVTANSHSQDRFQLIADLSSQSPYQIHYDSNLEIVNVSINGRTIQPSTVAGGGLLVPPEHQTDQLSISFRRRHASSDWFRRCKIPDIAIDGHVVQTRSRFAAGIGTLMLHDMGSGTVSTSVDGAAAGTTTESLIIVPQNVLIALGLMMAGVLFVLSWSIARWLPLGIHACFIAVTLSFCAAIVWWRWQLMIVGWISTPITLAMILHSVLRVASPLSTVDPQPTQTPKRDETRSRGDRKDRAADFSISTPPAVWLLAVALTFAGTTNAIAQTTSDRFGDQNEKSIDPVELLVPLDGDLQQLGNKVYLRQDDYQAIVSASDPDRLSTPQFQSANYRMVLSPGRETEPPIIAQVQADYQILLQRPSVSFELPIQADSIRRIERLTDGETQILRYTLNSNGQAVVAIPETDQIGLRVTLVPQRISNPVVASTTEEPDNAADEPEPSAVPATDQMSNAPATALQTTTFQLKVPMIHSAKLVVEAPREIEITSLGPSRGRQLSRADLGRYEADLGPIDEISVSCVPARQTDLGRTRVLRRIYRVSTGAEQTVIECEIEPLDSLAVGDSISLVVVGSPPVSTLSEQWEPSELDSGDAATPAESGNSTLFRRIYRFTKQTEGSLPIRMFWRLPSTLNDPTSTQDSKTMAIPEVYPLSGSRQIPTFCGIETAPSIRVSELVGESVPIKPEDFQSVWNGFLGPVNQAFMVNGQLPSLVLWQDRFPKATLNIDHHLHIDSDHLELRVTAEQLDLRPWVRRSLISAPMGFRLVRCLINGTSDTSSVPIDPSEGRLAPLIQLAVGDQRIEGKTTYDLVFRQPFRGRGVLTLPQVKFLTASVDEPLSTTSYRITRSGTIIVTPLEFTVTNSTDTEVPPESTGAWRREPRTLDEVLRGRVPVAAVNELPAEAVRCRVKRRTAAGTFQCLQKSLLRYTDGQWTCDTFLQLPGKARPDVIDVEIPTRWANDLRLEGTRLWGKRLSVDEQVTVVRIGLEPDAEDANTGKTIRITSSLSGRVQNRVSAPDIVVLGSGPRNRTIAVPEQLTTEPIEWRKQETQEIKVSETWYQPFGLDPSSIAMYTAHQIEGSNWSIELQLLSQTQVEPAVLSSDTRVYLGGRNAIVHQRFDVLPETLNEVAIQFPAGAECIGIWAAGREVNLDASRSKGDDDARTTANIPLAYSRLPQSLEILMRIPVSGRNIEQYACSLNGIESQENWVSYYQPPPLSGSSRLALVESPDVEIPENQNELQTQQNRRALALAQSVATAVKRSKDRLAERGDDEIRSWLSPWIARYQLLANEAGHAWQMTNDQSSVEASEPPNKENENDNDTANSDPWQALDDELMSFAGRFFSQDSTPPDPLLSPAQFRDFQLIAIQQLETPMQPNALKQTYVSRTSLQTLLVNLVTLVTFTLAIILLWPFRGRFKTWINEPALWLFVFGCIGLLIIPLPLAVTLIVISTTVPLIKSSRARAASPN